MEGCWFAGKLRQGFLEVLDKELERVKYES